MDGLRLYRSFFAFSDALERRDMENAETKIRVYALSRSFLEDASPSVVIVPNIRPYIACLSVGPRNNPRLYAQQGQFVVTNVAEIEQFVDYLENLREKTYLFAVDVPVSCAEEALEDLAFMGLTAANLFPGLDGFGRMLKHSMTFRRKPPPKPSEIVS